MRRVLGRIALALIGLLAIAGIYAYQQVTSIQSERVTDDVNVLYGLGGNVGVLATSRGAVIVDSMTFRMQGARIRDLAEKIGRGPIQAIINTHYHRDHTHGNPAFAAGSSIWSTQRRSMSSTSLLTVGIYRSFSFGESLLNFMSWGARIRR